MQLDTPDPDVFRPLLQPPQANPTPRLEPSGGV